MPPPSPVWSSPLTITGASRKPFVGRALAGRRVERELLAGRDQRAVDQVRDELDVVDAVRVAAVDRLVAGDELRMPIACASAVRALGLRGDDAEPARCASVRDSAAARTAVDGLRGVELAARASTGVIVDAAARVHGEAGVDRRVGDALAEPLEVALGGRPADAQARRAVARELEKLRDAPARETSTCVGPSSSRTGAESATRVCASARREADRGHRGRRRSAPAARRARARSNPASARTMTSSAAARSRTTPGCAGTIAGLQAVERDRGVSGARRRAALAILVEVVRQRRVVDARRRRDLGAEEAHAQAAKPLHRAEAVARARAPPRRPPSSRPGPRAAWRRCASACCRP